MGKRRTACGLVLLIALLLAGCDVGPLDLDAEIPLGEYAEVGTKIFLNDTDVIEGLAGVYLQRVMVFENETRMRMEVFSDWKPETGTVRGTYDIDGDELTITVTSSTSSFYEVGEQIFYDDLEIGTLNVTFTTTGDTFFGPGFLLRQTGQPDLNDLDGDGNRLEDLVIETYFLLADV